MYKYKDGTHLPTLEGWKAEVALGDQLVTYRLHWNRSRPVSYQPAGDIEALKSEDARPDAPPVMSTRSSATAEIARLGGRHAVQGHSRSFKVTDVSTNRKPVCDFLLMNNNNFAFSHRFPIIAQQRSKYDAFDKGVPLSIALILGNLCE